LSSLKGENNFGLYCLQRFTVVICIRIFSLWFRPLGQFSVTPSVRFGSVLHTFLELKTKQFIVLFWKVVIVYSPLHI
jgi:hypothetical protein